MAGKGVYAALGVKPGNAKALSHAVTAKAEQHEMMSRGPSAEMLSGLRAHLAKHFPDAGAASSAAKVTPASAPRMKAPRSAERNAALLNKLQDRAGRARMKNDPSYEQKRSRLLAVKAALPAEHVKAAGAAREAKRVQVAADVKRIMSSKGGPGLAQVVGAKQKAKPRQPRA